MEYLRAFGWSSPRFVHLPLITRDGKKKLSKRDKDAFVDYYDKEMGVLPQAVINFLVCYLLFKDREYCRSGSKWEWSEGF